MQSIGHATCQETQRTMPSAVSTGHIAANEIFPRSFIQFIARYAQYCIYNNIVPASGEKRQRRVSVPARPQYGNAAVRERRTGFRFRKTSRRPFAAVLPCKRNPPQRYERAQAEDSCRETERKPMKEPPPAASIRSIRRTGRVRRGIRATTRDTTERDGRTTAARRHR